MFLNDSERRDALTNLVAAFQPDGLIGKGSTFKNFRSMKLPILIDTVRSLKSKDMESNDKDTCEGLAGNLDAVVPDNRLFVLSPKSAANCFVSSLKTRMESVKYGRPHLLPEFTLPFPVCSFESAGGVPLAAWKTEAGDSTTYIHCILAVEMSAHKHTIYLLHERCRTGIGFDRGFGIGIVGPGDTAHDSLTSAVLALAHIVGDMTNSKMGTEEVRKWVRVGSGKKRRKHKISQIVVIAPKSDYKKTKPVFSSKIDWSHRWEVRGHWRRVDGIGKNRDGEYVVPGHTFVVPHEKGKGGVAAVRKTRVFRNEPGVITTSPPDTSPQSPAP